MDKLIKTLQAFIPFIAAYPYWVKIFVGIWILLTAVIIIAFIFAPRKEQSPKTREKMQPSVAIYPSEPVLEVKIDLQKILNIINKGNIPLEDINVFATKYIFDENLFKEKQLQIKDYNKIGGAIRKIESLGAGEEIRIDLKEISLLHFFENPGKEDDTPILTYYCFRTTYRNADTGEKHILYKVASAIKNFPSWVDNQEYTAYAGTWGDFMFEIPDIIIDHQKKIYND